MRFVRRARWAGRVRFLCAMVMAGALAQAVAADVAPAVDASTKLVVLNALGTGFANLRKTPDPRSEAILKVATGAAELQPTGRATLFGDTWWIEVKSGAVTGWLNARLAGYAPSGTPLQPLVNIAALQPVQDYDFKGNGYRSADATSYEECARRCIADTRCVAIAFKQVPPVCSQFDSRVDASRRTATDIAAKSVPDPEGGWAAAMTSHFDRFVGQAYEGAATRERIAHSRDECAATCSGEPSCIAYAYQSKSLLCARYDQVAKAVPRLGYDLGVRVVPKPAPPVVAAAAIAIPPLPKVQIPTALAPLPAPLAVVEMIEPFVQDLTETAVPTAVFAAPQINRKGRVIVRPITPAINTVQPADVSTRDLEGDVNNLAPRLDPANPGVVHLVFYAEPMAPPVVFASAKRDTETEAVAVALKLQKDLDEIARITGLGVDRFALLKPLRR